MNRISDLETSLEHGVLTYREDLPSLRASMDTADNTWMVVRRSPTMVPSSGSAELTSSVRYGGSGRGVS